MEFQLDLEYFESILPNHYSAHPVVDLRECGFARPEAILGIFLLLRHIIREGGRPKVIRPLDSNVDSYIERNGVYARTIDDVDYEPHADDIIMRAWGNSQTMQAITPVTSQREVSGIVDRFALALESQFRDSKTVRQMKSAMIETFQNMPEHANPKNPSEFEGYTSVQLYLGGRWVVVAAGDLGVGIKRSLQTSPIFSRMLITDLEALEKTVFERASRYRGLEESQEHGGGLHRAKEIAALVKGIIVVRSGCAAIIIKPYGNVEKRADLKYFPGTQVTITVRTF